MCLRAGGLFTRTEREEENRGEPEGHGRRCTRALHQSIAPEQNTNKQLSDVPEDARAFVPGNKRGQMKLLANKLGTVG